MSVRYQGFTAVTLVLALVGALPGAVGADEDLSWIDVHVHFVGGRGMQMSDYAGPAHSLLKAMDESGMRLSVVMPSPQISNPPPYDCPDFLYAIRDQPKRIAYLCGGGTLNSMLQNLRDGKVSDDDRASFEKKAEELLATGAAGFGEIAAHHYSLTSGHPYESVPADHPLLLLLADIAARHDVVIDLHFDPVVHDVEQLPPKLAAGNNPAPQIANLAAFERLLDHNPKAKIVWAHAGSDFLGQWTPELSRRLLQRHPNLYMSLRVGGGVPRNRLLDDDHQISPGWLAVLSEFPDRFVIGGDQFIASAQLREGGPGAVFAEHAAQRRKATKAFLAKLPPELARKIAYENAVRLYRLSM